MRKQILAAVLLAAGISIGLYSLVGWARTAAQPSPLIFKVRDRSATGGRPVLLPLARFASVDGTRADGKTLAFPISPGTELSVPFCVHIIKSNGLAATIESGAGGPVRLIDVLTHNKAGVELFGKSAIFRTDNGIRYAARRERSQDRSEQSHRDLCLALFAESGVPLSQEISLDGQPSSLADVLRDSLAEFHLGQREIAWTALAYALYLPPANAWANRYGEQFSLNSLADNLLSRNRSEGSCEGIHLLFALIALSRVNEREHVLSNKTAHEVDERLRDASRSAAVSQEADGSWRPGWGMDHESRYPLENWHPEDTAGGRLLVTSHLAELIIRLPESHRPPISVISRANSWLRTKISEASQREMLEEFCPYSHAIWVVNTLCDLAGPASKADRSHNSITEEQRSTDGF